MAQYLLIGMALYRVVSRHDTEAEADAAKEKFDGTSNIMELGSDWPGFTGVDLARVYNAAVSEVDRIKRFENRATAVKRVNELLTHNPDGHPPPEPVTQQETKVSASASATKAKIKRKKRPDDDAVMVALTAEGKKEKIRFNEGSLRGRVHETIKRADSGEVKLDDLVRRCSNFAKRGQVIGCVDKLVAKGYAKRN